MKEIPFLALFIRRVSGAAEISLLTIRAELPPSVEKTATHRSRTNVVCKEQAAEFWRAVLRGWFHSVSRDIALHTSVAANGMKSNDGFRDSPDHTCLNAARISAPKNRPAGRLARLETDKIGFGSGAQPQRRHAGNSRSTMETTYDQPDIEAARAA